MHRWLEGISVASRRRRYQVDARQVGAPSRQRSRNFLVIHRPISYIVAPTKVFASPSAWAPNLIFIPNTQGGVSL